MLRKPALKKRSGEGDYHGVAEISARGGKHPTLTDSRKASIAVDWVTEEHPFVQIAAHGGDRPILPDGCKAGIAVHWVIEVHPLVQTAVFDIQRSAFGAEKRAVL